MIRENGKDSWKSLTDRFPFQVASDESSFTEEGGISDGEKNESADREIEDAATSSASK